MKTTLPILSFLLTTLPSLTGIAVANDTKLESPFPARKEIQLEGWTVLVDEVLITEEAERLDECLGLLETQLKDIKKTIPKNAVEKLIDVRLFVSFVYPGTAKKAEYHPSENWLRENGRDPRMAKSVEFTNWDIFAAETKRMPWFVLHELAHAYHDLVLQDGFQNRELREGFERAKASGSYDRVERRSGRPEPNTIEAAYALTNPMEFFAESTESFFGTNDFAPFNREELEAIDPKTAKLIAQMWGAE